MYSIFRWSIIADCTLLWLVFRKISFLFHWSRRSIATWCPVLGVQQRTSLLVLFSLKMWVYVCLTFKRYLAYKTVQTFWAFWGDNMPVWSLTPILAVAVVTFDFFPSEAEETSPFGVWFLTFNCSRAALCRFPCRCELRTVSLWAVTWHRAQVHTFWTFSGGSIS